MKTIEEITNLINELRKEKDSISYPSTIEEMFDETVPFNKEQSDRLDYLVIEIRRLEALRQQMRDAQ